MKKSGLATAAHLHFQTANASLSYHKRQLQVVKCLHLQSHIFQNKASAPCCHKSHNIVSHILLRLEQATRSGMLATLCSDWKCATRSGTWLQTNIMIQLIN